MNKFKKSTLTTAIALILCCTTLAITAFAATQNLSAYETLKSSLIDLTSLDNATIAGSLKLLDNGKEITSAELEVKLQDLITTSSKISCTINGETFTEEQWSNSEQTVSKSSEYDKFRVTKNYMANFNMAGNSDNAYTTYSYNGEVYSYNTVAFGGSQHGFASLSASEQKLANAAIDLVVGDIKNYFTTNGNTITLNLQKDQIPQIVQLLVSVLAEKSGEMHDTANKISISVDNEYSTRTDANEIKVYASEYHNDDSTNVFDVMPRFTDDTSIKSGNLSVTLDDNQNISSIKGTAEVTGTDVDGTAHTLTLEVDLTISDIGSTVADAIDLSDKEVDSMTFTITPFITVQQDGVTYYDNGDEIVGAESVPSTTTYDDPSYFPNIVRADGNK